jgi:hypothetical protein
VANNAILKEGFVALSGALLLTSPQLQELNLAGNNLGILGAVCVSSMLQRRMFSSLRQFDISNNALGAPGWLVHAYKYWRSCWYKSANTDATRSSRRAEHLFGAGESAEPALCERQEQLSRRLRPAPRCSTTLSLPLLVAPSHA